MIQSKNNRNFYVRLAESPVAMTWGSLSVKILGNFFLMPLMLVKLTTEESNLWLLFFSLVVLQNLIDFGFSPTFTRVLAYSNSKSSYADELKHEAIIASMKRVYLRIALLSFFIASTVGTAMVWKPVSYLNNPYIGWLSWSIVAISSCISLWGGLFRVYLEGTEKIALLRRWQFVTGCVSILLNILILLFGYGSLLSLVFISHAGNLLNIYINYRLIVAQDNNAKFIWHSRIKVDKKVMDFVWPATWRSGLGVLMTYGTIQGTAIFFAQVATPTESAAYLLSLRLIEIIKTFAIVPFQVKIPYMARLYATKKKELIFEIALSSLKKVSLFFLVPSFVVGVIGNDLLDIIGSNIKIVQRDIWFLIVFAFFAERIGAANLQLYSLNNNIRWHFVNGISGAIILLLISLTYKNIGIISFPISIALSYIIFYIPYSANKAVREYGRKICDLNNKVFIVPFLFHLILLSIFFLKR